jgi:hypothetical protein
MTIKPNRRLVKKTPLVLIPLCGTDLWGFFALRSDGQSARQTLKKNLKNKIDNIKIIRYGFHARVKEYVDFLEVGEGGLHDLR